MAKSRESVVYTIYQLVKLIALLAVVYFVVRCIDARQ